MTQVKEIVFTPEQYAEVCGYIGSMRGALLSTRSALNNLSHGKIKSSAFDEIIEKSEKLIRIKPEFRH